MGADKIDLDGKIAFEPGKDTIRNDSYLLLNELASVLVEHTELVKVRIDGYARGEEGPKQKLSEDRAVSVLRYLVYRGVDATRLHSSGRGDELTEMEFLIEERKEE